MSLPPIAPPPPAPVAAAAAPGLPPRQQPPSARPTAAPRKGTTSEAPAKPPRRGRGAPAERPGPLAGGAWPSCGSWLQRKEPRSRGAPGSSSRCPPPRPQAAAGGGAAAPLASPALARGRSGVGPPGARSSESLAAAPGGRGEAAAAVRFSLSLPPEAIRVLQRRSLESRRPPRPRAWAPRSASPDAAKRPLAGGPGGATGDWRALLQVSLLNERHRYDDVEYEEDEEPPGSAGAASAREGLVRKCTEWLRGVESAAAQERADKLDSLPHLSTL